MDIAHSNAMNLIIKEDERKIVVEQRQKGCIGCMLETDKKLFLMNGVGPKDLENNLIKK